MPNELHKSEHMENLDLNCGCKPQHIGFVLVTLVNILLYRPPIGLIETQYSHLQLSDPVYNSLFELYRQSGRSGQLFVLQFVPVLVWTYLSATTRRDELVKKLFQLSLLQANKMHSEKGEKLNCKDSEKLVLEILTAYKLSKSGNFNFNGNVVVKN